jgi:hypothetical protein
MAAPAALLVKIMTDQTDRIMVLFLHNFERDLFERSVPTLRLAALRVRITL